MEHVSNYAILFFLEWIKKNNQRAIPLDELFLDKKYYNTTLELATEFLKNSREDNNLSYYSLQEPHKKLYYVLHSMVDDFLISPECDRFLDDRDIYISHDLDLKRYHHYISYAFYDYLHHNDDFKHFKPYRHTSPQGLVYSVQNHIRESDPNILYFCKDYNYNNNIVLTLMFLEWVKFMKPDLRDNNLTQVPTGEFTRWIDEYIADFPNVSSEDKKHLLSLPRQIRDKNAFILQMNKILPKSPSRTVDLRNLITRHMNENIKFRCLFLPYPSNSNQASGKLKIFVEQNWATLNDVTGSVLDLYYSRADLDKSQFEGPLKSLTDQCMRSETYLPALALWDWEHGINNSVFISLQDLDDEDILVIFNKIRQEINNNSNITIREIKKSVDAEILNLKEGKKTSLNVTNTFTVTGGNNIFGPITMGGVLKPVQEINIDSFSKEVNQVVTRLDELSKLESSQKNYLILLLEKALQAIKDQNQSQRDKLIEQLIGYGSGLGNISSQVLSILGSCASIASFFGIHI